MEIISEDLIKLTQELTKLSVINAEKINGVWIAYIESGVIVASLVDEKERQQCENYLNVYKTFYPGLINPNTKPDPSNTAIVCSAGGMGKFKKSNVVNAFTGFFEKDGSMILLDHSVEIDLINDQKLVNKLKYVVSHALCYKPNDKSNLSQIIQHFLRMHFIASSP